MSDITTAMKHNHVSFPSSDVSATAAFFEDHLDRTVAARGTSCFLETLRFRHRDR
ncbi:hypothetical protein [Paraburkholderia sp. BL6665CI2N2]|uniref:hypothetical protein n=1 Tax=Paraburkholderia sp. BL6665CI2N2 TaxID=1938806 RepID=UPI003266D1E9